MLDISTVKAKSATPDSYLVVCVVGVRWFRFGFAVHEWGLRLLCGPWHFCVHRSDKE